MVFLGGLQSHSLTRDDDHALRDDFVALRRRLAGAAPWVRPVYFSYGAGPRLRAGGDPAAAWAAPGHRRGGEAVYAAADTTDWPLADHVGGLAWLLADLISAYPSATFDLVGFSLGGVVAMAWAAEAAADDLALTAVHRIVLVGSPVGGVTRLGHLCDVPPVRSTLGRYRVGFGEGVILRDLALGSPAIDRLPQATRRVDVASVENSRDHLVNGRRITGQVLLPTWVRTIPLGRGAAASALLPREQCYVADLGGWDRHLRRTHHQVLRGTSPAVARAHDEVVRLIVQDGPRWTARRGPASCDRRPFAA